MKINHTKILAWIVIGIMTIAIWNIIYNLVF
jgi:uncharacterized membrane protein